MINQNKTESCETKIKHVLDALRASVDNSFRTLPKHEVNPLMPSERQILKNWEMAFAEGKLDAFTEEYRKLAGQRNLLNRILSEFNQDLGHTLVVAKDNKNKDCLLVAGETKEDERFYPAIVIPLAGEAYNLVIGEQQTVDLSPEFTEQVFRRCSEAGVKRALEHLGV